MKQLSLGLNILLLVLVGILFYLHFNMKNKISSPAGVVHSSNLPNTPVASGSRIAYFEMDSLQSNYLYFKDALNHLQAKEQAMNAELAGLEKAYQKRVGEWQQKGSAMSQAETDAAQRENAQMQQNYQARKQVLEEAYARQSMEFKKDIKKKIESFLKVYNQDKQFSYILSYEPDFIFYRDSTANITADLISGLNATYKKKE